MSRSSDAPLTAAVFAVAGAFAGLTALPGPHWHDTAEFAAVGARLSLSHPPGHPVHAVTTHAAQLVPLGDAAFRANLASAFALAAALALFFRLLRRLAPGAPAVGVAAAALLPVVMPVVWLQGARAEVYALQLVFSVIAADLCRRAAAGDDARAPAALALAVALAGANHSLVAATWIPLGVVALALGVRRARPLLLAVPAGLLGLAAYAYLPLRAHAGAEVGWGVPDTVARVVETITAREWQRAAAPDVPPVDLADNLASLTAYGIDQVGPVVALALLAIVLAGTPRLVRERRWMALGALAVVALAFATRVVFPLDLLNPDLGGYVLSGLLGGVALAVAAADAAWRPAAWIFVPLLAFVAPRFDPGERMGSRAAEIAARRMLAEVPPGGTIVFADYASWFLGAALRAIEGARPDAALLFRGQIHRDWFRERLSWHRRDAAARAAAFPAGYGAPGDRFEPGVHAEQLAGLASRLRPVGLTLAADGPWPSVSAAAAAFAGLAPEDLDTRRGLAFVHLQHAEHVARALAGGGERSAEARALLEWHLARADALAPGDPFVADARARAGGPDSPKPLDAVGGR